MEDVGPVSSCGWDREHSDACEDDGEVMVIVTRVA